MCSFLLYSNYPFLREQILLNLFCGEYLLAAAEYFALSVNDENMPEAVCPVFEAKLSAPDLILFYVKILARSKLLNRNRTADVLRAVGLLLGRRVKRCDLDSLFNVKLARLSVRTKSAVVVYSVCYVGTLLYLSDEDTLAYRMESSGLYEENVTSFYGNAVYIFKESIVGDRARNCSFVSLSLKP